MKNILSLCFLFLVFQVGAQKNTLIHDDHAQVRQVGNFSAINVSSAIDVYLTQDANCQVAVSAGDDETRDHIKTYVEDGTLFIKMDYGKSWKNWNKWGNHKLKAYVSINQLTALIVSGASNIHLLSKLDATKLSIKLSGASDFEGTIQADILTVHLSGASDYKGSINAKTLSLELSGSSNIELNGAADNTVVNLSGASDAKLYELLTKNMEVDCSGASAAKINVANSLKAHASGASEIHYKGLPSNKEIKNYGASSVKQID